MVMKYGMSERLGTIQFGDDQDEVFLGREIAHSRNYGEGVAAAIDEEVKNMMDHSYSEAIRLLNENIDVLHASAKMLVEKEKITGDEFRKIMADPKSFLGTAEQQQEVSEQQNTVSLEKETPKTEE